MRESYSPKVLQAKLYEANLRWDESLRIREEVARENPRWFEAHNDLGDLLLNLAVTVTRNCISERLWNWLRTPVRRRGD